MSGAAPIKVYRGDNIIGTYAHNSTTDALFGSFGIPRAPSTIVGGLQERGKLNPITFIGSGVTVPGGDYDVIDGPPPQLAPIGQLIFSRHRIHTTFH
jgi:hypothetical protein